MLANESDLEKFGDRLSRQHGHKVVVFGHTHVGKIDKDSLFVKDRVYANSGCWCGKEAHCVVVEPGDDGQTAVSLLSIDAAGEIVEDGSLKVQV
jgi:hypothetical protein